MGRHYFRGPLFVSFKNASFPLGEAPPQDVVLCLLPTCVMVLSSAPSLAGHSQAIYSPWGSRLSLMVLLASRLGGFILSCLLHFLLWNCYSPRWGTFLPHLPGEGLALRAGGLAWNERPSSGGGKPWVGGGRPQDALDEKEEEEGRDEERRAGEERGGCRERRQKQGGERRALAPKCEKGASERGGARRGRVTAGLGRPRPVRMAGPAR